MAKCVRFICWWKSICGYHDCKEIAPIFKAFLCFVCVCPSFSWCILSSVLSKLKSYCEIERHYIQAWKRFDFYKEFYSKVSFKCINLIIFRFNLRKIDLFYNILSYNFYSITTIIDTIIETACINKYASVNWH